MEKFKDMDIMLSLVRIILFLFGIVFTSIATIAKIQCKMWGEIKSQRTKCEEKHSSGFPKKKKKKT